MTINVEAAESKAETTYNAASDSYDATPLEFWSKYGRATVQRLDLSEGDRVLDVCCGSGASAIPAAEAVGSNGGVIAIDLAEDLLKLGREKATTKRLRWLEYRRGDMTAPQVPDDHFDAVICVFGIFFVSDMESQVAKLWRLVKPGGQLAITTWGPDIFAPAYEIWLAAVRRVRPDLCSAFNPWDRITMPEAVDKLFADAGVQPVEVVAEMGHQVLHSVNDFWIIARGSGLRWTIDQMNDEEADSAKREVLSTLSAKKVNKVATNVIYAVAKRPSEAV